MRRCTEVIASGVRRTLLPAALLLPLRAQGDEAAAFFASQPVVQVELRLDAEAADRLRAEPRRYVDVDLRLDGETFARASIKLKGAAGSFQPLDERPGFTVRLGRSGAAPRFHGLQRFHLNNGAQDDSRLCEWLGHAVFRAAGRPAPRVAHALVRLDERDLGLYVFREAFDAGFVERTFGRTPGNLYDGGFCQDLDQDLEKDAGAGVDDHSDLQALAACCAGIDQDRADRLAAAIDVPQFVDFLALEAMLGHWDGYAQSANNYRLWLPRRGGAVFLPHGMDQLFGDPTASVLDHPPSLAASAVLQQPAFRARYRERLRALLPQFEPERLLPQVDAIAARLQAALREAGADADAVAAHADAVQDLRDRIAARHRHLVGEVEAPDPVPLALAEGVPHLLAGWEPFVYAGEPAVAATERDGEAILEVVGAESDGTPAHGGFRTDVVLGPGRYELRGSVRCAGVVGAAVGEEGDPTGAWLEAAGVASPTFTGTTEWQSGVVVFEVRLFQQRVELACAVHARAGQVGFRRGTLVLVRVGD